MILSAIAEKLKRRSKDDFKGRHFEATLIVQAVSWYLRYPLSDNIEKCAEHMKEKDVRRMLVLDKNKRLVGVVSLGDISKAQEGTAAETLKDITEAA